MSDQSIPTFEELKEIHGDPADGGGGSNAVWACQNAVELHMEARNAILNAAQDAGRDRLSASEQRAYDKHQSQIRMLSAAAEQYDSRQKAANQLRSQYGQVQPDTPTGPRWHAGQEEVYRRGGNYSYFQDLMAARMQPTPDVTERLSRHAQQMDQRIASKDGFSERARRAWVGGDVEHRVQGTEFRVNPNRTDGQGGWFVPPAYLIEQYIDYARPARATADLCRPMPLPSGTDQINVPKVSTGTATGVQTADGAAVTSTDMTDENVQAPVRTIAGQQDFALQLLEQSPIGVDEVIFRDLQSDYNQRFDLQIISGTGSNGQHTGILNVSGINSVTYTDASPTLAELYPIIPKAKSQIANGVYRAPTAQVWSSKRWYWAESILDSGSRPFVGAVGPYNGLGGGDGTVVQGAAGVFANLPVVADPNVPANLGAGTDEDRIIVAAWPELLLWEGAPRVRLLTEVLSGTLQVRAQLYAYSAFMPHRRPTAISVISGTGMIVTTVLSGF